jgi:pyrimidine-specific ribonucleoside hydrolase
MKNFRLVMIVLLLSLTLVGCINKSTPLPTPTPTLSPVPLLTFTFRNGTCDYEGPDKLDAGKITLKFSIEEGNTDAMDGVAVVGATIDEGKTFADLDEWPSTDQPPWVDVVSFNEFFPTGNDELDKEFSIRLSEGPVFFVCFFPDAKIGTHGPLEIVQNENQSQASQPTPVQRAVPTQSPNPLPVVIDTDMALDDWMAILYLLNRTDVAVKAITVTGAGEAHCVPGVNNALKLIRLAGLEDIPVACGRETPLAGDHTFPQEWRDFVDSLAGITLPVAENPNKSLDAKMLIKSAIESSEEKITVLTLGPLTNIADLLRDEPQLAEGIQKFLIMGGAVEVPGNVGFVVSGNNVAEFNFYVDPLAASEVFLSNIPITLVPLDATNQVPLDIEFYNRLEIDHPEPEAEFVYDALTGNFGMIQSGGYFFWDPLAGAIMVDESIGEFKDYSLCVETAEGPNSGQTIIQADCPLVQVAVNVDKQKFSDDFLDTLNAP